MKQVILIQILLIFKHKAILLGNTTAKPDQNQAHEILKNVTVVGSLMYLRNFWRLFEMINCIVELKLKRTKYCVLSEAGADNVNANPNKIIFTIKTQNYGLLLSLYQQKTIKTIKTS